ncbi:MAG: CoA pyrophosphatase [Gammaproteobacteria bacterium]|nr:CoA pyrophosphatase [Gammaproteobacteria bacterium]
MESQQFRLDRELRSTMKANLASFERVTADQPGLRAAAVAIAIVGAEQDDTACFLLTIRAAKLKRHRGQYALPGGRIDEGEDTEGAALRELSEELGLTLAPDQILGQLDDFPTRSGFRITPVVVWGGMNPDIKANPHEVESVFRIPLQDLLHHEVPRLHYIPESEHPVLSAPFPTLGDEVFAPTAAMLFQFREVALSGRSTRVAHYEQPTFAWS